MKIIRDSAEFTRLSDIAFVPTMGALHAGHRSLIKKAQELANNVVVSIYVNPLQFENERDLAAYPRTPASDAEVAREAGATHLWLPTFTELFPNGVVEVNAGEIGERFEGISRKNHFNGVVTIVNALFGVVKPRWALFGEKDLQQLFLIREMTRIRGMNTNIVACETIRDRDGLALSSRNVQLSPQNCKTALVISRALRMASAEISLVAMHQVLREQLQQEKNFVIDYAEIIDGDTFEIANERTCNKRAIVAGWVDGVRLIDSMSMASASKLVKS